MALKLVDQWQKAWKWFSVQISAVGAAAALAWTALPDDLKSYVPHRIIGPVAIAIFVAAIGGRVISQQKPQ